MIRKQIKAYGKTQRQRIDLANSDGFSPGSEVVLLTGLEYDGIMQNLDNLKKQLRDTEDKLYSADQELQILHKQENNLKKIIEDVTAPIDERYKKQLESKDQEIKQLKMQLNTLQAKTTQFNLELMGLNTIDMLLKHKHKKLIHNFNDEITILVNDPKLNASDVPALQSDEK